MGAARAKREALRRAMLLELDRWMEPASDYEAQLLAEIEQLEFYSVPRASDREMEYGLMEPQQCHLNCGAFARLDPRGETQHISGWWKRDQIYFFHSVVLTQTKLICITPHPDPRPLTFAPDPKIRWIEADGVMNSERDGPRVPFLVRREPTYVIDKAAVARDALLSGVDPYSIILPG